MPERGVPEREVEAFDILPRPPAGRDWRIGAIGAGFVMRECHLPAYRRVGISVTAIAGPSRTKAEAAGREFGIGRVETDYRRLLDDPTLEVVDIAVPPDVQAEVIEAACDRTHIRGILAQKPLGVNLEQAQRLVARCRAAGKRLVVNQNMRYDPSIRAAKRLLERGRLGEPVLATIEMRAVPHWMPWQERQGWVTLRIMSIHHLDAFRFLFGDPRRVYASVRPDPRTAARFAHADGIALVTLEYDSGLRCSSWDDVFAGPDEARDAGQVRWRIAGTRGLATGEIGWPRYPARAPSTIDYATVDEPGRWHRPRWDAVWFPDAFAGPMCELLTALETGETPDLDGADNLRTMAVVEACYLAAAEQRAIDPGTLLGEPA
jgi:hypothetical protein